MIKYRGVGAAQGICLARMHYLEKNSAKSNVQISFDEAIKKAVGIVQEMEQKTIGTAGGEQAKIFFAYEMLLSDSMLTEPMRERIATGKDASVAVREVAYEMSARFLTKENEYMRQRGDDIRYVGELLCDILCGKEAAGLGDGDEKVVLAAKELTPLDTMSIDTSRLAGMVTNLGGATSHTVLLAKSLGIPAVVGVDADLKNGHGKMCFVDGYSGEVVADADSETEKEFLSRIEKESEVMSEIERIIKDEAYTKDNEKVEVLINIGSDKDVLNLDADICDGVGLFRTEFMFSSSYKKPTKEEQQKAYARVAEKLCPKSVIIRTLDIGGDKPVEYMNMKKEDNPFLGNRGIRLMRQNEDVFAEQIEAIITSAEDGIKIMLPMITSADEIDWAREILDGIEKRLDEEGIKHCKNVQLGIMIETPASAVMADELAQKCDFMSIGTNDLVQYVCAADRGNVDVESVYNPYNKAVLRLLCHVVKVAKDAGIEVSVCGDIASDEKYLPLLVGIGIRKISVPVPLVGRVKRKIAQIDSKNEEQNILEQTKRV